MSTVGTIEVIAKIDTSRYSKGALDIDRANQRVIKSTNNADKQQSALNKAIKKYGEDSDQARLATLKLNDAQLDLAEAQMNLESLTGKSAGGMNKALVGVAKVGFAALATAAVAATAIVVKNIDGAIDRIDALVAFPRVLKALGVSGEEAEAATRKLSDSLQGLPTSLNQGTRGVQGFITSGLDVNKATDAFLGFNNAMLAAGVETGAAEGAMMQLNQALSRGRIDGAEWNSIAANIPTVMQALQNETGKSKDELRELFREDPQALIDNIIRLNKEGGGGIASLEEQARNATGGIRTALENMDNAVQRSIQNIVTNLGGGDLEAGQKKISDFISNMGKALGDGLTALGNGLDFAIKAIQQVMTWLQPLTDYIKNNETAANVLKTTLMVLGGILLGVVLAGIVIVVGAVALLTGVIHVLVVAFTWLMETAIKVWNAISTYAVKTWAAIKSDWSKVTAFFGGIFNGIVSFFSKLPGRIGGFFRSAWNAVKGIWQGVSGWFGDRVNGILGYFRGIPSKIRNFFRDALNAVKNINWVQLGSDIISGIVRGLNPSRVIGKMKDIASSAMDTVKSFLGIKSPSRVFMAIGGDIMAGWAKGLDAKPVVNAMDSATNKLMSAASPFNDISTSGTFNVVGGNKAFEGVNGSSTEYNIGTITIASEVDGERWLRRLSGNQEIVSNGLVPRQSYM